MTGPLLQQKPPQMTDYTGKAVEQSAPVVVVGVQVSIWDLFILMLKLAVASVPVALIGWLALLALSPAP